MPSVSPPSARLSGRGSWSTTPYRAGGDGRSCYLAVVDELPALPAHGVPADGGDEEGAGKKGASLSWVRVEVDRRLHLQLLVAERAVTGTRMLLRARGDMLASSYVHAGRRGLSASLPLPPYTRLAFDGDAQQLSERHAVWLAAREDKLDSDYSPSGSGASSDSGWTDSGSESAAESEATSDYSAAGTSELDSRPGTPEREVDTEDSGRQSSDSEREHADSD